MSRTYKATGINLKSMPLGESDRLLTILTSEFGLIRAVAPGARKQNSSLSGRSGLFVVNELLIASGRSLDKITQAETLESYPGLSQDLGKLAASQYLAEMVLSQALSEQPQEDLYCLLNEHLSRLEQLPKTKAFLILSHLTHAVFHLLALAGITPQVQVCCLTQQTLTPEFTDPNWQVGFSVPAGGTVSLAALATTGTRQETPVLNTRLSATELALLQQLAGANLSQIDAFLPDQPLPIETSWLSVERILRSYVQYHLGRPIRSATLIDSYFASMPTFSTNHDATV